MKDTLRWLLAFLVLGWIFFTVFVRSDPPGSRMSDVEARAQQFERGR